MTPYRHTQIGTALLSLSVGSAGVCLALAAISPKGSIPIVVAFLLLVAAGLFWKLTITVDNEVLLASFGPGLIYKQVRIDEIDYCEPMRIRAWHGWGIHLTPAGWLYNVSGSDAVVVVLRDGRRYCFGTDEPRELEAAIRRFASSR